MHERAKAERLVQQLMEWHLDADHQLSHLLPRAAVLELGVGQATGTSSVPTESADVASAARLRLQELAPVRVLSQLSSIAQSVIHVILSVHRAGSS